jgi:hypothetical protein
VVCFIGIWVHLFSGSVAMAAAASPKSIHISGTPFEVERGSDRDEDCLEDVVEHQIANHFRPYLVFDSHENARRPNEPLTLYQVSTGRKRGQCTGIKRLKIAYDFVFTDDGGYARSHVCGDSHRGDNPDVTFIVDVHPGKTGAVFSVNTIINDQFVWPRYPIQVFEGSHPVIYSSAGKHHMFFDQKYHDKASPYSKWRCHDSIDGLGPRFLAVLESRQAPDFRLNVGEAHAHPRDAFVNDLAPLGFAHEDAWDTQPFCGGYGHPCGNSTAVMRTIWLKKFLAQ